MPEDYKEVSLGDLKCGDIGVTADSMVHLGLGGTYTAVFTPEQARRIANGLQMAAEVVSNRMESALLSSIRSAPIAAQPKRKSSSILKQFVSAMKYGWNQYQQDKARADR